ncbi:MAG: hypothetical protein JWR67_1004 [Mucilaginibacter sp.]|nr:hypothetical protein [Mucilaginibacter sp.]MDB5109890.1 hypothetical protein [Mucilaginibacter sp.]
MKIIKISVIAIALIFSIQFANAQVSFGVRIGYPARYQRVIVERPYDYNGPEYYHPYAYHEYYERPVYRHYGRPFYRHDERRFYRHDERSYYRRPYRVYRRGW